MANPLRRRMPTGFYRFPGWTGVARLRKTQAGPWFGPSRPVLDQVAARHRHVLDQRYRATLIKMPSRILLVEGILRRHAVDWHDHLEAALGRTLARACDRALRRGAGDDHGADTLLLECLLEIGVVPLV